jgi:multiple sugar transport system permease protein
MKRLLHPYWWRSVRTLLITLCVLGVTLIVLGPLIVEFKSSLQPPTEIESYPPILLPIHPTLANFANALGGRNFYRFLLNSMMVASATAFASIVVAALAAFALSRLRFRGQELFSQGVLLLYMFPSILLVVPLYLTFFKLHLVDSMIGLIISYVPIALPLCIWMLEAFFNTIPKDLDDAAMIDGCTRLGVIFRVVLPLSAPGVAATAVFAFMTAWGEYIFAITFINSEINKTVVAGLYSLVGYYAMDHGLVMAASVFVTLPPLLLFFAFQRYLIAGLTMGAVKG